MLTETKTHTPQKEAKKQEIIIPEKTLLKAYQLMTTARAMSDLYEERSAITAKYVHAASRGHEAVQLAMGLQLKPQDISLPITEMTVFYWASASSLMN